MPVSTLVLADARAPVSVRLRELAQRRVQKAGAARGLPRLAQLLGDRVAGAVADLEEALRARAAAAGEAVAAVRVARELDPELLEPVDRGLRVAGERLDERRARRSRATTGRRRRRAARASRRRRRRPGSRPAPSRSCSPGASPWSRARPARPPAPPTRRRRGPRRRSRSRARRTGGPAPSQARLYLK